MQKLEYTPGHGPSARLSPWGDLKEQKAVELPMSHRLLEDMDVHVVTRPGWLGMEWIDDVR